MTFTCSEFRKALGAFPTGVAVAATRCADGLLHGMTVSSFNSVSLDPPLVLFAVARNVVSFSAWQAADRWGISILGEAQDDVSARFAKSGADKWSGLEPVAGVSGVPLVPGALAHFECERHALHDGGDHVIFIGRVVELGRPPGPATRPLVFFSGRYHRLREPPRSENGLDRAALNGR